MAKSIENDEMERAISWITDRVRHLAKLSAVGTLAIKWKTQENLFVMEIEGGGKKAAKLFERSELTLYPLEGEKQKDFDAHLVRLVQFLKKKSARR